MKISPERKMALKIIKALKKAELTLDIKKGQGIIGYGLREACNIIKILYPPNK